VAYCPLRRAGPLPDATLTAIAASTAPRGAVALKWLLDQDGVAAIPKASRSESQKAISMRSMSGLDDEDRQAHRGAAGKTSVA